MTPPDPPSRMYWWFVALAFIAAAGVWLAWRTMRITRSPMWRVRVLWDWALSALVAAGAGPVEFTGPRPDRLGVLHAAARSTPALADKKTVVLEFTAEWCLNCKTAPEKVVLQSPRVVEAASGQGVVPMKVDLTGDNGPGNAELNRAGAVAIPFLAVLSPEGTDVFMSDAYTPEQILDAIKRASQ